MHKYVCTVQYFWNRSSHVMQKDRQRCLNVECSRDCRLIMAFVWKKRDKLQQNKNKKKKSDMPLDMIQGHHHRENSKNLWKINQIIRCKTDRR